LQCGCIAAGLVCAAGLAGHVSAQGIIPGPPPEDQLPDLRIGIDDPTERGLDAALTRIGDAVRGRVRQSFTAEGPGAVARRPAPARRRLGQEPAGTGMDLDGLALWASYGVNFLENDFEDGEFDGSVQLPLVGADYLIGRNWVLGLSLGYEHTDLDTDFNQETFENDGLSITPFFGLRLTEHAALDAGLGHARLSYDRSRDSGAARGSFDADRVSVFANLSGTAPQRWHGVQGLSLLGDVGFRYAREDQDGFEEGAATISSGTVELGQVTFGGEARFGLAPLDLRRITVFARAEGAVDVIREDRDVEDRFGAVSDDRTDVTPGVGVIAALTDRVSADLACHHTLSREEFREQSPIAGVRFAF
jgi:opacity protein-like surface antigen